MRVLRRSYGDLIKIAIALFIVCGIGALSVWQWPNMVALYRYLRTPATEGGGVAPHSHTASTRYAAAVRKIEPTL